MRSWRFPPRKRGPYPRDSFGCFSLARELIRSHTLAVRCSIPPKPHRLGDHEFWCPSGEPKRDAHEHTLARDVEAQSAILEYLQHPGVFRQDFGGQLRDPGATRKRRKM